MGIEHYFVEIGAGALIVYLTIKTNDKRLNKHINNDIKPNCEFVKSINDVFPQNLSKDEFILLENLAESYNNIKMPSRFIASLHSCRIWDEYVNCVYCLQNMINNYYARHQDFFIKLRENEKNAHLSK